MYYTINQEKKKADLHFGKAEEKIVLPKLESFFNCELRETEKSKELNKGKYCKWDFENEDLKVRVEVKSRRINHNDYKTALLDYHKLAPAKKYLKQNPNGEYYFVFNYRDGLYYCEYEEIQHLKGKTMRLHRGDRPFNIEIPIEILDRIEEGYEIERN